MPVDLNAGEQKAFIDHYETLECDERNGVVYSLTRAARVVNVLNTDYQVLMDALDDLDVPKVPSFLSGQGFEALMLEDRHVKMVDRDTGTYDVILRYRHILDGPQELQTFPEEFDQGPFGFNQGVFFGKMKSSIQQKPTNFFFDWTGDFDPFGNGNPSFVQLVVEHTYPGQNDPHGNPPDPDFPGETYQQGGEINVPVPHRNYTVEGFINTSDPDAICDLFEARVNKVVWKNKPPRSWLCSEVEYRIVGRNRYHFRFEFQQNPNTWDEYVVFIDQRTGRPPPGLIYNFGYYKVPYNMELDFDEAFGGIFEGEIF